MSVESDWLEQNLFNTIAKEKFFSDIQGKRWFHTHLTEEAINNLPGWEHINSFLSNHRLSHPRVRVSREGATNEELTILRQRSTLRGEPIYETLQNRVYDNLRLGSTLVLDAIDIAMPEVRRIASSLAKCFFVKAQTNGYVTFSESRGFGLHWDDHDVFIVQVHGKKTWHLYGNTREAPMHQDFHDEHPEPTEILETIELTPGSLLYVPRGCWHDVVGQGEPTFHLTFGVTLTTGVDLLVWLQETARHKEFLRQDIPLHQPEALESYSKDIKNVILEFFEQNLIGRFMNEVRRSSATYPVFSLPYGINGTHHPPTGAFVRLIPNVMNIIDENESITVEANNLKWRLPKVARKLVVSLQNNVMTVTDSWKICCDTGEYTQDEWVQFLGDLVGQGLISINPSE